MIMFLPVLFFFISVLVVFSFVTEEIKKIIIADLIWGMLFVLVTYKLLTFHGGEILLFLIPLHFIVNGFFLFFQGLLTRSKKTQFDRQKKLRQKKICFVVHVFFSIYFFYTDWTYDYFIIFSIICYFLYDYFFSKVIGCKEPAIINKLITMVWRNIRGD